MEAMISKRGDLTEGSIVKKLLAFFLPIAAGLLFQQLYNTVDAVIVGKFVGTQALAATGGSASTLINLVIGFFNGIGTGATVIISQRYGANEFESVKKAVHTILCASIFIGIGLMIAGYFLSPWALRVCSVPEDTLEEAILYLRIYLSGSVPLLLFNVGSGILRAVGDSRRPLIFLAVCCFLNIGLDLLFVVTFKMGVAGAGWATVISLALSAVLTVISLMRDKGATRLCLRDLRIDGPSLSNTMRIGIPSGIQSSMFSFSNLLIMSAVNGLGTATVAAWAATGKIDGVYWVISSAFSASICAFVGQCFGAGRYERMRKSIRVCLLIDIGVSVAFGAIVLPCYDTLMRLITNDAEVVRLGVDIMKWFIPFYFVWAFIEVISSALRGVGDAFRPTAITIIGICGLRILWLVLVIPHWHTIASVSLVYAVSWIPTAIAFILYYYKSDWFERVRPKRDSGPTEN